MDSLFGMTFAAVHQTCPASIQPFASEFIIYIPDADENRWKFEPSSVEGVPGLICKCGLFLHYSREAGHRTANLSERWNVLSKRQLSNVVSEYHSLWTGE